MQKGQSCKIPGIYRVYTIYFTDIYTMYIPAFYLVYARNIHHMCICQARYIHHMCICQAYTWYIHEISNIWGFQMYVLVHTSSTELEKCQKYVGVRTSTYFSRSIKVHDSTWWYIAVHVPVHTGTNWSRYVLVRLSTNSGCMSVRLDLRWQVCCAARPESARLAACAGRYTNACTNWFIHEAGDNRSCCSGS